MGQTNLTAQFPKLDSSDDTALALLALRCLDLTSLTGQETGSDIESLVRTASLGFERDACSICAYPQFVPTLNEALKQADSPVKIAIVINFPNGEASNAHQADAPQNIDSLLADMDREIRNARDHGADELDIVFPRQSFLNGDLERCAAIIGKAASLCHDDRHFFLRLKVIMESSAFEDKAKLAQACAFALDHGADMLKTSTGKHPTGGADPVSAQILIDTVMQHDLREHLGVKISGGIKTLQDVALYAKMAEDGGLPLTPDYFRIGASGLVKEIYKALGVAEPVTGTQPASPAPTY